jgi:putative oxidoreductase
MIKSFLSPSPIWLPNGIATLRITIGLLLTYHGLEVFNSELMQEYTSWESFEGPNAALMVYAGKSTELISGILLLLGFLTRMGAILLMGALSYVTFFVGAGRFWYEDQHPFMFVLFGLLFLFTGPGSWSVDRKLFS